MVRTLGALALAWLAGCDSSTSSGATRDGGSTSLPDGGSGSHDGGGSGGPDAGTSGTPDGGAGAAVTCATPGLLFCDDFEATALGTASSTKWTTDIQSGALTIDATHAQGTRALHVHTDGNGRALIRVTSFAPPGNSFYGRARVWATAFPTAPNYAHFTMVEAAAASGTGGVVRPIGGQFIPKADVADAGRSLWGVGSDGGATGDWTNWKTAAPAEAGRWLCMEWQMRAADSTVNVWIDSIARPELSVSKTSHGGTNVDFLFPTFTQIFFGWWLYQASPTPSSFDLWLDDIALGTSRIGC